MRKSKFTREQILQALRQAESGTAVVEICRKLGVTEPNTRWAMGFMHDAWPRVNGCGCSRSSTCTRVSVSLST